MSKIRVVSILIVLISWVAAAQTRPAPAPRTPMQGDAMDLTVLPSQAQVPGRTVPGTGQTMPMVNYDNLRVETAADQNQASMQQSTAPPPLMDRRIAMVLGGLVFVSFLVAMWFVMFHPAFTGKRKLRADMPD